MSDRTIRNWARSEGGRRGRPPQSPEVRRRAFRLVVETSIDIGWSAGWRKVHQALAGAVSVRLVQECLRKAKRLHRDHERQWREGARVHVEVPAANVIWHQDATHLGRTPTQEVQADVVRDAAHQDPLAVSVGGPVSEHDAVRTLEAAIAAAGGPPLVQSTDNGPAYASKTYQDCLRSHRIVHLRNVPHTPQHNARGERVIRDVKAETPFGRGVRLVSVDATIPALAHACARLELRAHLTSQPVPLTVRYTAEQRERFYQTVCSRVATVVHHEDPARVQRMAEREAILAALEERGLIRRTRGGTQSARSKAEINS